MFVAQSLCTAIRAAVDALAYRGISATLYVVPNLQCRPLSLNRDPLDLVEAYFVPPAIIQLGGSGRCMICHRGGFFQRATVLQAKR